MADLTKVQQAIQSANVPGVQKLNARASGNTIEVTGVADSIAAKQAAMKAITSKAGDTGIVNKIEVKAPQSAPQAGQPAGASPAAASVPRTHKVLKGETLSHIAQKYYGKASAYNKIFEANRDQIKDPDKIREGMVLNIP